VYGVLGSVTIGWGILLLLTIHYPFREGEGWAWTSIVISLTIWYFADTGVSLYHGVFLNAVSNTFFLMLFGIPLIFTRKYFQHDKVAS
jgi:uncharacterized membrane protein